MKKETGKPMGVALICDRNGTLVNVINDSLGYLDTIRPGQPITTLFSEKSVAKGFELLQEIRDEGTVHDWELYVGGKGEEDADLLYFSGADNEGEFLLIGASSRDYAVDYYNELMKINNEHVNELRSLMKDNMMQQRRPSPASDDREEPVRDDMIYEQMTRLNNELTSAQRKLAKKTSELEQSNQRKNQMLGMAAHDLRSPLTAIRGLSGMLLEEHEQEGGLSDEQHEFIREIHRSSQSMVRIIEDLLDISAIESGSVDLKIEECDLIGLVDRVVHLHDMEARKKNIALNTELPEGPLLKEIDPHKFEQVMDNLVSNALKYSHPGTVTTVGLTAGEEGVSIYVADQGKGIPEDKMDRLFKPFGKVGVAPTGNEKSTGLGLAIIKRIVQAHGGQIHVKSEQGVGSTFRVELP